MAQTKGDRLQCCTQKVYVRSVHNNKDQSKLLCLFLYASNQTTERSANLLSGQPINIPRG